MVFALTNLIQHLCPWIYQCLQVGVHFTEVNGSCRGHLGNHYFSFELMVFDKNEYYQAYCDYDMFIDGDLVLPLTYVDFNITRLNDEF